MESSPVQDAVVQFVATLLGVAGGYWTALKAQTLADGRAAAADTLKESRSFVAAIDLVLVAIDKNRQVASETSHLINSYNIPLTPIFDEATWEAVRSEFARHTSDMSDHALVAGYFARVSSLSKLCSLYLEHSLHPASQPDAASTTRAAIRGALLKRLDEHVRVASETIQRLESARAIHQDPPSLQT